MMTVDVTTRTAQANVIGAAAVNGHLYIKSGLHQLLVDISLGATPFAAAAAGVTSLAAAVSAVAVSTGTAVYFQLCRSDLSLILSGSVRSAAGDLTLSDTYIVVGDTITIDALSYVAPEA
jgi:hypothetical protein